MLTTIEPLSALLFAAAPLVLAAGLAMNRVANANAFDALQITKDFFRGGSA